MGAPPRFKKMLPKAGGVCMNDPESPRVRRRQEGCPPSRVPGARIQTEHSRNYADRAREEGPGHAGHPGPWSKLGKEKAEETDNKSGMERGRRGTLTEGPRAAWGQLRHRRPVRCGLEMLTQQLITETLGHWEPEGTSGTKSSLHRQGDWHCRAGASALPVGGKIDLFHPQVLLSYCILSESLLPSNKVKINYYSLYFFTRVTCTYRKHSVNFL